VPLILGQSNIEKGELELFIWYSDWDTEEATVLLFHSVHTGCTAHPTYHSMSTEDPFSWIRRSGSKSDHSFECSDEVKNACSCILTYPYVFLG